MDAETKHFHLLLALKAMEEDSMTVLIIERDDHIKWCAEEFEDLLRALKLEKSNGNRPIEVSNIAAQMSVIVSQLALAARG